MIYMSVCTLLDQNGATTGLVCGELLYMRIYFFIFLMRSLWKYYGSKIVMSDVQSSFQNSDGLALSSMGHKIKYRNNLIKSMHIAWEIIKYTFQ